MQGMVGSGLCFVGMSWCVKKRGPVFTAAFSPLVQILAAAFDVPVLHEQLHLGRWCIYIYMLNKITRIVNVLIDSLSLIWMCWVQFIRIGHCYRWIIHFAVGQRQRTAEARNRTSAGNSSRDSKGGPKTWVSTRYNIRLGTIFFVYFHPVYTCTMRLLSARM